MIVNVDIDVLSVCLSVHADCDCVGFLLCLCYLVNNGSSQGGLKVKWQQQQRQRS